MVNYKDRVEAQRIVSIRGVNITLGVQDRKAKKGRLSGVLWQRGGKRKESLQLRLWNLNICIEKFDAKY